MKPYFNKKGQPIGVLKDKIFRKRVSSKKHLLKLFDAWGMNKDTFEDIAQNDCKEIRILDEDTDTVYQISLELFWDKMVVRTFNKKDGEQCFVSRKFFSTYPNPLK